MSCYKSVSYVLIVGAILGGISPLALAQDEATEQDEPIEEIRVYGEKSVTKLKFEFELAEESFYDLYSELNDDWEYDVICRKEAPTGSHIKHQVCWPRYELEARSQEAMAKLRRGHIDPAADATVMSKNKRLRERIATLSEEHPQLLEAMMNYHDKYRTYRSERAARCAWGLLACGSGEQDDD